MGHRFEFWGIGFGLVLQDRQPLTFLLFMQVSEAKQKTDEAKLNAYDVLMKTNRTKQRVDQSNEELRGLIKQIRDFLTRMSP